MVFLVVVPGVGLLPPFTSGVDVDEGAVVVEVVKMLGLGARSLGLGLITAVLSMLEIVLVEQIVLVVLSFTFVHGGKALGGFGLLLKLRLRLNQEPLVE